LESADSHTLKEQNIDVVDILHKTESEETGTFTTRALTYFLLHYLEANRAVLEQQPQWRKLTEFDLRLEHRRWPPRTYLEELQEYQEWLNTSPLAILT
jgi:hypothetical protein